MRFVILIWWFCGVNVLMAQTSLNVKVKETAPQLQTFLSQKALYPSTPAPTESSSLDYLSLVESSQSLSANNSPELASLFTIRLTTPNPDSVIQLMEASGQYEFVELNRMRSLHHGYQEAFVPNDDSLASQWYLRVIEAEKAWDITQGSRSIKIGVIDTGLDFDHPEFDGQVYISALEDANQNGRFDPWPASETRNGISGDFDGVDNDQNGYIDDVVGYDFTDQPRSPFGGDFVFPDPNPSDDNNHGTAVSGIIAAKINNGQGIAGMAPNCQLVVLRAFAANGGGEDDDIARAIVYAADNGVDVLNFSFGDVFASQIAREAVRYADRRGVVMVGSAGNGTGDDLHYPSGYPEVISVSATTQDPASGFESLWQLSSYGLTVDLAAPGADMITTSMADTLADGSIRTLERFSGTSFAAPLVASAAALLLSQDSSLSPAGIRSILTSTADDVSREGWDHFTGAGRLNVLRALEAVGDGRVEILAPIHDKGSAEDSVAVIATVLSPQFEAFKLDYRVSTEDTAEWHDILTDQLYQRQADTIGWWNLDSLAPGEYTLRVQLALTTGKTLEDRVRFVIDRSAPKLNVRVAAPIWDNDTRAYLIVFRSDDYGQHQLYYRPSGTTDWNVLTFDRLTRNGEFLLPGDRLATGTYEWYIHTTNLAGLSTQTDLQTFEFRPTVITQQGWTELPYGLPLGRMLSQPTDMDQDGLKEVVMSPFDGSLAVTQVGYFEFRGDRFVQVDSVGFKRVLIPKDLADSDGDGLMELLCSVNDSNFILEQATVNTFPQEIQWQEVGRRHYAARFGDTDGDGQLEVLLKDFNDYFVFDGAFLQYDSVAKLEDNSGNYLGSIAPRALVGDFDGDGRIETVYGDFDGDLLVYEHQDGNVYERSFLDTTDFRKSGNYIAQGDFNGDGEAEIFLAVHQNVGLRNDDNEYDALFFWLRILKASGDNTFEVLWEDYLYDIDIENTNAATAAPLLDNGRDQLIFTTFPRTYLFDWEGDRMVPKWFYYGSLATHHIVGDFNGNGVPELGLGRIDSTKFFEPDQAALNGPSPVEDLRGAVLSANAIQLDWSAIPNATSYQIWRVKDPSQNDTASVIPNYLDQRFLDPNLDPNTEYLYVLRSNNEQLNPSESGFGNVIVLTPHEPVKLDSAVALSAQQIVAYFSYPVDVSLSDQAFFTLDGEQRPITLINGGGQRQLILSFAEPMLPGTHVLEVHPEFQDRDLAYINPDNRQANFLYVPPSTDCVFLQQWEQIDERSVRLYFNAALTDEALDPVRYQVRPAGSIAAVSWVDEAHTAVELQVTEPLRIGALGNTIGIRAVGLCATSGICLCPEGNTAAFSTFREDLSEVFVYPNPVQAISQFEGARFANLTQSAIIEIYTLSGRMVRRLGESDGDGGVTWDLTDEGQVRITPGVYLYRVYTDNPAEGEFVGTFTVVE